MRGRWRHPGAVPHVAALLRATGVLAEMAEAKNKVTDLVICDGPRARPEGSCSNNKPTLSAAEVQFSWRSADVCNLGSMFLRLAGSKVRENRGRKFRLADITESFGRRIGKSRLLNATDATKLSFRRLDLP
jgi:hypothetical protein